MSQYMSYAGGCNEIVGGFLQCSPTDCVVKNLALCVIFIMLVYYFYYIPSQTALNKKIVEGYGNAYDASYLATFPTSATVPYAGPQGYGQWFTNGPPNVG